MLCAPHPAHPDSFSSTADVLHACPSGPLAMMPWRRLAMRVIDQAFRDLASPAGSQTDQESARTFLAGSTMFYHWCDVADLDPALMVARARTLCEETRGAEPGGPAPFQVACGRGQQEPPAIRRAG
jgi:hypothetical protein